MIVLFLTYILLLLILSKLQNVAKFATISHDETAASPAATPNQTQSDRFVEHISRDIIRVLSQEDTKTKIRKAVNGLAEAKHGMGVYWNTLWRELGVAEDGRFFWANELSQPRSSS